MPIRLNLFAEAQAAEDMRRRDPVKRAIILGAFLVALMLMWSSYLQLKATLARKDLGKIQAQIKNQTSEFQQVINNQKKNADTRDKLAALHQLATNRFLNATMLNALQQAALNDVQLSRLRIDQTYALTDGVKAMTNGNRVIPAKPATETEKILLTLEAKDISASPGDRVIQYPQALANHPYFLNSLGKTNEVRIVKYNSLTTPPEGRPFMSFSLECRFPDKTR